MCDILDTLANAAAGVSLSALADATGLPKSSAFLYRATLESRHYVERDQRSGAYYLVHAVLVESPHMMRLAARAGDRGYVHSTAPGKVICMLLPERRIRSTLVATGMPRFTATTLTEPEAYPAELEHTRIEGYGLEEGSTDCRVGASRCSSRRSCFPPRRWRQPCPGRCVDSRRGVCPGGRSGSEPCGHRAYDEILVVE
ncbi:IclR family transcriptional regulator domain-containing protein [Saccharopolyspora sp. NPDC002376]